MDAVTRMELQTMEDNVLGAWIHNNIGFYLPFRSIIMDMSVHYGWQSERNRLIFDAIRRRNNEYLPVNAELLYRTIHNGMSESETGCGIHTLRKLAELGRKRYRDIDHRLFLQDIRNMVAIGHRVQPHVP